MYVDKMEDTNIFQKPILFSFGKKEIIAG